MTGVHGDAAPGESLHVRHGRIVILLGVMRLFLFENAEHAAGRGMTFRAGAHGGAADQDAVAIHVHGLLRNAHEHYQRTARRELWLPPVLARLERSRWLTSRCTLGVK